MLVERCVREKLGHILKRRRWEGEREREGRGKEEGGGGGGEIIQN